MKIYIMRKNIRKVISKMETLYLGEKKYTELRDVKSEIKNIYDNYIGNEESEELALVYYRYIFFLLFRKKGLTISKEIE